MEENAGSEVAPCTPRRVKRVRVESYPGALPSHGGRRAFWVEAPRRHVLNRLAFFQHDAAAPTASSRTCGTEGGEKHRSSRTEPRLKPAIAPHRLTVVVASAAGTAERTAFLQPVAETQWRWASREAGEQPPSIFAVPIYVWGDSTLREVLELVLARSEAARTRLLGSRATAASLHGLRARKAPRREIADSTLATANVELPSPPETQAVPAAVKILSVSMGTDRLPVIHAHAPLATLSLTRPPTANAAPDRITIDELCASRRHRYRLGDLLVFVPSEK